jgi:hypothetical protein
MAMRGLLEGKFGASSSEPKGMVGEVLILSVLVGVLCVRAGASVVGVGDEAVVERGLFVRLFAWCGCVRLAVLLKDRVGLEYPAKSGKVLMGASSDCLMGRQGCRYVCQRFDLCVRKHLEGADTKEPCDRCR